MKTIRQSVVFKATPEEVYDCLMDSKKHSAFTGGGARISQKVGGEISAYDGYIDGTNVKLVKNKKIVQRWRASEWPAGVYSVATFTLTKVPGGTKLTLVQTGVPDEQFSAISDGWHEHYWEKMREFLE